MNLNNEKLYEMKSHDYNVFMQTVIPLAYRNLLSKGIYDAIMEISYFLEIYALTNCISNTWISLQ
jgi:hypothetical protein